MWGVYIIFSGLQNYAKSEYKFRPFTCRTDIRKKNSVSFRQAVALSNEKTCKRKLCDKILQTKRQSLVQKL